jgi:hypothetical protein
MLHQKFVVVALLRLHILFVDKHNHSNQHRHTAGDEAEAMLEDGDSTVVEIDRLQTVGINVGMFSVDFQ